MQSENNPNRSSVSSEHSDTKLSVRDARRRFEQMSSTTSGYRKGSDPVLSTKGIPPSRPAPPKPLKKRVTDPEIRTLNTSPPASATSIKTPKVQRSTSKEVQEDCLAKDRRPVSPKGAASVTESPKHKSRSKLSLKKAYSVKTNDLASAPESSATDSKLSATKKLFKRKTSEKGKMDGTTSNGSTSGGRTNSKSGKTGEASPGASPTHKKSPLASLKKKVVDAKSPPSNPSSRTSSPAPSRRSLLKSFSDKVLVSSEDRSVQASLKEEDRGKVVGGNRPTAPRVIEDGELKFNLTEGEHALLLSRSFLLLSRSVIMAEVWGYNL